ncbi:hypothetical protein K2X30_01290 [bacterium]|jgi:hypothetical protein|nr:hypothetical protein [bacterium]
MCSKKAWMIPVSFLLASVVLSSCNSGANRTGDPRGRLNSYISDSFSVKSVSDRKTLEQYLTGNAKKRLEAWSDEQFLEAFVDNKRKHLSHSFRDIKSVSDGEVNITYELTYLDQSKGHDAKVTSRKLARLVRDEGKWMIGEVYNIKELIEYKNEMSLP